MAVIEHKKAQTLHILSQASDSLQIHYEIVCALKIQLMCIWVKTRSSHSRSEFGRETEQSVAIFTTTLQRHKKLST